MTPPSSAQVHLSRESAPFNSLPLSGPAGVPLADPEVCATHLQVAERRRPAAALTHEDEGRMKILILSKRHQEFAFPYKAPAPSHVGGKARLSFFSMQGIFR